MAKVLRCPACGALWRANDDFKARMLRCTQCQAVFSADKIESVTVPDAVLDARLAAVVDPDAKLAEDAKAGENAMTALAGELADFEGRDAPRADESVPADAEPPAGRGLWTCLLLAALLIGLCSAALLGHKTVLSNMPQLQSLYEKACGALPCPGFVWQNAEAFTATASIEAPIPEASDVDREMARRLPVVNATLTNNSTHPQRLPILELRLLDAAGDTMAQRILEPADYGYASDTAVASGDAVKARLTIKTPLPYDAAGVAVTPVVPLH